MFQDRWTYFNHLPCSLCVPCPVFWYNVSDEYYDEPINYNIISEQADCTFPTRHGTQCFLSCSVVEVIP